MYVFGGWSTAGNFFELLKFRGELTSLTYYFEVAYGVPNPDVNILTE